MYINPKASHKYATEHPGHESLNFNFNKKGIDTNGKIHGHVQWTADPKEFQEPGTIIFYSKNTETRKGEIVGIYGNVEVLHERKTVKWDGFENNQISFSLRADKDLSLLFPIPLNAENYKKSSSHRLVGQIGYSYYDEEIAERIIRDELLELSKSGLQKTEFKKLKDIYVFVTGSEFDEGILDTDLLEQDELSELLKSNKKKILEDLKGLNESDPEEITINHKTYKRDNKTVAQLKILRNFECQICGTKIKKGKGGFYIEAAHIKPKSLRGRETPDNILILCPNHHKEFDFGTRKILEHTKELIKFSINGSIHEIDLKIE